MKPAPKDELHLPVIITTLDVSRGKEKKMKKKGPLDPKEIEILHKSFEVDKLGVSYGCQPSTTLLLKRTVGLHTMPEGTEELKNVIRSATATLSNLLRSTDRPKDLLVQHYTRRALAYEKLNRLDIAQEEYTNCIIADKFHAESYFNRAGIHRMKGNLKGAIKDINKAVELQPENLDYMNNRNIYYRDIRDYETAAQDAAVFKAAILHSGYKGEPQPEVSAVYRARIGQREEEEVINPIEKVMAIPPERRSGEDVLKLVEYLKGISYFSVGLKNQEEVVHKIANKLTLQRYEEFTYIFKEKDEGHYFYIILSGNVRIEKLIKRKKTEQELEEERKAAESINEFQVDNEKQKDEVIPLVTLKPGANFGIAALESADSLRTASAVCLKDPVMLLGLHAADYHSILGKYQDMRIKEVRELLMSSSSLFRNLPEETIEKLALSANVYSYGVNQEIIQVGAKITNLTLIKKGLVKIVKAVPVDSLKKRRGDNSPSSYCELEDDEWDCTVPGTRKLSIKSKKSLRNSKLRKSIIQNRQDQLEQLPGSACSETSELSAVSSGVAYMSNIDLSSDGNELKSKPRSMFSPRRNHVQFANDDESCLSDSDGTAPMTNRERKRKGGNFKKDNRDGRTDYKKLFAKMMDDNYDGNKGKKKNSQHDSSDSLCSESSTDTWDTADTSVTEKVDLAVAMVMTGQTIGELAVIDPGQAMPISAITCSTVEVYCFDVDLLESMGILQDAFVMRSLQQSWSEANPKEEDVINTFRNKYQWQREKSLAISTLSASHRARIGKF